MKIPKNELIKVLASFNPWWRDQPILDLPSWKRACFHELSMWVQTPPAPRAVLLSGARQVGKTTLMLQVIKELLQKGTPATNILYITFDHPIVKLGGIERVLEAWREYYPKIEDQEYFFLDEAQNIQDWGTWIKHQVDFNKSRKIVFTGSAMPLMHTQQESGVGRWHTIRLTTLSFYEYLNLKGLQTRLQKLPSLNSLHDLFNWAQKDFYRVTEILEPYVGHFHEYLLRGGFPQTTLVENVNQAQRLLRDDIIDKVLKRDMTAMFGVRRISELEMTFLYLCMHGGGLLDMAALGSNLKIAQQTVLHFIELLEATHLIYRLPPFSYGKEILRARYKVYLADAAIAPAVLMKGKGAFDEPIDLGIATETAVFKHMYTTYSSKSFRFTYWRDKSQKEVDLIMETGNEIIPFEVKYRFEHTGIRDLKGLLHFCENRSVKFGYVVTKSLSDFGLLQGVKNSNTKIMRIPAPLLCYWMGEFESINGD